MAPKPKKAAAFDVTLSADQRVSMGDELCRAVDGALQARAKVIDDGGLIDLFDFFYEQGRSDPADLPFPGAADLTSYFVTEDVDAYRSRLMKAVFGVRPFCFVEGWGPDAAKAPAVEEFLDWQVRQSGLKLALAKTIHGALIEDGYILEVSEKIETRRITEQIDAAIELNEQQAPVFLDGHPKIQVDDQGDPVPADAGKPSAKIERSYVRTKRMGPQYDPISLKEFVFLPGHAKSAQQVWGYAYRFWRRVSELGEDVKDGIYDKAAVATIGEESDRNLTDVPTPVTNVASQETPGEVEKELFQLSLKRDLDKDGREEWYIATIHRPTRTLLRLKLDTFVMEVGISRCVPFMLFPRRDSVYGYSFTGDKLLTLAEEHTSLRNMKADRSNLATNAPMTVLQGALWDPDAEPIGIGRTIHVRDHNEVRPMVIPDVPNSVVEQEMGLHQAKERVSGLSDGFSGIQSTHRRTATENRIVAGGSGTRVDETVGYLQLAIADVMRLTYAIYIKTLEADPKGMLAPDSVAKSLKTRGVDLQNGRFTADQLKGNFQFEPYGSDANADPETRKANFTNGLMALANLAKVFAGLNIIFQSHDAAKAVLEQWCREFDVRDRQPFLGAFDGTTQGGQVAPTGPPQADPMQIQQLKEQSAMKQAQLDFLKEIWLQAMKNASSESVAHITAAKMTTAAPEEAQALSTSLPPAMSGQPAGAPPPAAPVAPSGPAVIPPALAALIPHAGGPSGG